MMKLVDIVRASKILPYFLSFQLFFPHQLFAQIPVRWTMVNEPPRIVTVDNRRFKASLARTKEQPYKEGWYVKDQEGNVIGDEDNEIEIYKNIIKAATISRYVSNSPDLDRILSSYISNFRKSIYGILAAKTAEFIRDVGSKIEGKLIRIGLTAHEDLDIEDISRLIYTEVRDGILKRFELDDSKIYSINDIAQRLKENSTLTSLTGIAESMHRLEKAREIVRNTSIWSYDKATLFYKLYKFGLLEGIAHLELGHGVNKTDWKKHAESIAENFGEGLLGVSFGELFKKSTRNRDLANLFKVEVREKASIFDPIDKFYSFKECSGNNMLVYALINPHNRDNEIKRKLETEIRKSKQSLNMPIKYVNLDCYTDDEAIVVTQGLSQRDSRSFISTILNIFKIVDKGYILVFKKVIDEIDYRGYTRKLGTKVSLYDLTGDGNPEIIVESEPQGSGGYTDFEVIGRRRGRFDVLLDVTDVYKGEIRVSRDNHLIISRGYPRENDPNCCPSREILIQYKWDRKKEEFNIDKRWIVEK